VAAVFEELAFQYGVNLECDGMDDDQCYGFVISQDTPLAAVLQGHMLAYDYLIIDGDPIRLQRRAVNSDLVIDGTIAQSDCIVKQPSDPAIKITRIDPMSLPREVEIQYTDPARNYATNTQNFRHIGAPVTGGKLTIAVAFVISADQARTMAADTLYRIWGQQLNLEFEHPDIRYEPGDVLLVNMTNGASYTVLITESMVTQKRTNQIKARALLTSKGLSLTGGQSDGTFGTGTGAA
jgi:hypothetical protein